MAQRIDPFKPRSGRPAIYPWPRWADGSAWRIERGADFEIPAANMAAVIRSRAHSLGLRATARVDGDAVEFRFLPVEEKAA